MAFCDDDSERPMDYETSFSAANKFQGFGSHLGPLDLKHISPQIMLVAHKGGVTWMGKNNSNVTAYNLLLITIMPCLCK